MKRFLFIILFVVISCVIYFSYVLYFKNVYENQSKISLNKTPVIYSTIHFGHESWPGFMMVELANKLGYFAKEGLVVDNKIYDNNEDLTKDFADGKLDGEADYASSVVDFAVKHGPNNQILIVSDFSLGGDGLVASSGTAPFRTSINPKIGYAGNLDFFLYWIIKNLGKTKDNVTFVKFESDEALVESMKKGKINYAYTFDPYLSEAINNGAVLEYSSKDDPGVVADVLSFNRQFIENNPKAIDAFTRAYFKSYNYWLENKTKSYEILGPIFGLSVEEFQLQMEKIKMLSLEDNNNTMDIRPGFDSIFSNLRVIHMFQSELDDTHVIHNVYELVYTTPVKSLYKEINK